MKSNIPAALKTIDLKAVLRRRGIYDIQARNKAMKEAVMPLARQLINKRHKEKIIELPRHEQFSNEEVMAYWEKQIHIVDVLEKKFDVKVQQFIGKIVDGFLAHLDQEIAVNKSLAKAKDYFDDNEDDLLTQAQFDFTPLLGDVALLAGQEAMKLAGSKDIYSAEAIRKQVADNVTKFTQSMLDTDRETLINIISDGLTAGESIPEIRSAITTTFDTIQKTQAQRITRTEVLRASNQASVDAYQQSGVVEGLQWLTAGADDECADYEGEIVALDGTFYDSESEFADGYPPLHPNCRCVVLPVLLGEKGYTPLPNKKAAERIKELEAQIDKRTKAYKELQQEKADAAAYIKSLEKLLPSVVDTTN